MTPTMNRAQTFLHLYNQLDAFLREITRIEDRNKSFGSVLKEAVRRNKAVRHHETEIKRFQELRNIIVHESRYGPEPIAEPNERAIRAFERLVQRITKLA